ncbi:MAG: peptide ABC transporter substrate-binding protein, partial [Deltaproteobacteria bacterium]|nr:peptide ABC transporter substrate-binding protein [Deltaproteobacteria bacterium]
MSFLELQSLKKYYPVRTSFFAGAGKTLKALDGVDLTVTRGEC